jgi:hypothetical protein
MVSLAHCGHTKVSDMSERTWRGDWISRIYQRVRARGFTSLSAFADSMPRATLFELATMLGDDVAAIQLEGVLRAEAEKSGTIEKFARDLLIRRIRQRLPMGWDAGEHLATERAGAFASWCAGVEGLMDESTSDAIWDRLEEIDIPTGWLPAGPDDPIIERAFAGVRFDAPAGEG